MRKAWLWAWPFLLLALIVGLVGGVYMYATIQVDKQDEERRRQSEMPNLCKIVEFKCPEESP